MISGDHESTCRYVGQKLGIPAENISAGVLPQEKAKIIQSIQETGKQVMMVGDGINDAIALSQADVGMVVGNASDISLDVSDVAMIHDDISLVLVALELSKRVGNVIKWNIGWAILYNLLALPIAAGVLQPWGISIPPVIAGLNEILSSLPVIGFSLVFLRMWSPPTLDGQPGDVVINMSEKARLL